MAIGVVFSRFYAGLENEPHGQKRLNNAREVDMPTIAIGGGKGGVGKSTIAMGLCHALIARGERVLLVETDHQGSLRDWNRQAIEDQQVPLQQMTEPESFRHFHDHTAAYEWKIIDGRAGATGTNNDLARKSAIGVCRHADLVLLPVEPSALDIWPLQSFIELAHEVAEFRGDGLPNLAFLPSRIKLRTTLGRELPDFLGQHHPGVPVLNAYTRELEGYRVAALSGKPMVNENKGDRVSEDLNRICDEVYSVLGLNSQGKAAGD